MKDSAKKLVDILSEKGLRIASAESCTGGMVSAAITAAPGASSVFDGTVVSYSNGVKNTLLGVPQEVLDTHGAVSAQCAEAMAEGVRSLMSADIGISLTGIAGPGGGTPEKPVGTVYLGISSKRGVRSRLLTLSGDRDEVREHSVLAALSAATDEANAL